MNVISGSSNVVIFSFRSRDRVVVKSLNLRRRMLWRVRGDNALKTSWGCVAVRENFLKRQFIARKGRKGQTHKVVCNCEE